MGTMQTTLLQLYLEALCWSGKLPTQRQFCLTVNTKGPSSKTTVTLLLRLPCCVWAIKYCALGPDCMAVSAWYMQRERHSSAVQADMLSQSNLTHIDRTVMTSMTHECHHNPVNWVRLFSGIMPMSVSVCICMLSADAFFRSHCHVAEVMILNQARNKACSCCR